MRIIYAGNGRTILRTKPKNMNLKAFFICIGAGAAFAVVSLWVILSGGKNAKAIRAKYRLGGALLTAWAMLSASTCNGPVPMVSCYEPVSPNPPEVLCYDVAVSADEVVAGIKGKEGNVLSDGDVLVVKVQYPTAQKYALKITPKDQPDRILQQAVFPMPESGDFSVEWPVAANGFKGEISLLVLAVRTDENGKETEGPVGGAYFTIQ